MSTFSQPFLRIQAGVTITPDAGPFASAQAPMKLAVDQTVAQGSAAGFAARIIFGGAGQQAALDFEVGTITLSASGIRQIEEATVTAAAGATANGNLVVTVTKNGMTGSPLAINVPLRTNTHTTATKIAAAIRDALNANLDFAEVLEALPTENDKVLVRAIYPAANDTSFNIAIAAGLGVSAASTSANATAGVAGAIVERLGGNGKDAFGGSLEEQYGMTGYVLRSLASSGDEVNSLLLGSIYADTWAAKGCNYAINSGDTLTAVGPAIIDVFILTK